MVLGSALIQPQALGAIEFFKEVADVQNGENPFAADIVLTWHSLGGGLAGLVAAIYSRESTLFNNMAFEGGAVPTEPRAGTR